MTQTIRDMADLVREQACLVNKFRSLAFGGFPLRPAEPPRLR